MTPREAGAAARRAKLSADALPFPVNSEEAGEWRMGWRDENDAIYIAKHGAPNQYARAASWRNRRR